MSKIRLKGQAWYAHCWATFQAAKALAAFAEGRILDGVRLAIESAKWARLAEMESKQ